MTDNKLQEKILKIITDNHYGDYAKSEQIVKLIDSHHLARLEAITDEVMVTEMGESAEEQRITHNNQYGAYKLGFRSCYEWLIKILSSTTIKPPKPDYEYEMFFDPQPDEPCPLQGWFPISTERIRHPEKIDHYLETGLLRRIK